MADTPPITIVRAPAWQALVRRLDAAVARDGRLAEARDVVLRPVELLRVMAADAHAALADDVLRGDRLRAMLFLAWPYVAVAAEARTVLEASSTPGNGEAALLARLVDRASTSGAAATKSLPAEQPYEPGVLDHAALLVVMLAAARVADPPFAPVFVEAVHGLALASSAAEVLGRLDPRQPDATSLDVVLETLYVIESARNVTRNEFLRPFVFDPVERGRWRCLEELLATGPLVERAVAMRSLWDGATSDEILSVKPKIAGDGDTITVTMRRPPIDPDSPPADPLRNATVVFASADGPLLPTTARVQPLPPNVPTDPIAIDVVVPSGAVPGWIGFSRSDLIAASNQARADVRKLLTGQLQAPCVDDGGRIDPLRSIPDHGARATPRRRGPNRFEGGAPVVRFAGVSPELARPGETVTIRWETAGAQHAVIELGGRIVVEGGDATGSFDVLAPTADGVVEILVTPVVLRDGRELRGKPRSATLEVRAPVKIANVGVTQGGRSSPLFESRPLDVVVRLDAARSVEDAALFVDDPAAAPIQPSAAAPGRLTFQVPADQVHDGMVFTVTVNDRTGAHDTRSVGPLGLGVIIPAQVVLVRPAILARGPDGGVAIDPAIDVEAAHARLTAAAELVGLTLTIVDLPWADDDLAVLVDRPVGDSDPALIRLLEVLSRRALLTPRFEGATWLALLPDADQDDDGEGEGEGEDGEDGEDDGEGDGGQGDDGDHAVKIAFATGPSIARSLPAYAARAVAVATASGLDRLFGAIYPGGARLAALASAGPRLAILGELDDEVSIEEVRADDRGEGPGAPVTTRLVAVTIDTRGRELDRIPIRVLTTSRPALIAALVPISSAVGAVELRDDQGAVLKVIRRARGELTLSVEPGTQTTPRTELHWTWNHSQNARPRVSLILRRGDLETPVFSVDPCLTRAELPLWRFAFADGLALYATDGWNPAEQPIGAEPLANAATVVLRRLSDGRFFADIPDEWQVTWLLNGKPRAENARTLTLASGDNGVLEIVAQMGGAVVRDSREVIAGDAGDRG